MGRNRTTMANEKEIMKPYYYRNNFGMTKKDMVLNAKNDTLIGIIETYPFKNWQESFISKCEQKLNGTGFYMCEDSIETIYVSGVVRMKYNIRYGKT